MRRRMLTVLAIAGLTCLGATAAEGDDPPGVAGFTCGFAAAGDPTAEPGTQTGEVSGGPIAVADLATIDTSTTPPTVTPGNPANNPASATIECSLQVNSPFHQASATGTENDNDAAEAEASGTVVVVLAPTQISFSAEDGDIAHLCTEWTLTGANGESETVYLDDADAGGSGDFVSDPTLARCGVATTIEEPPVPERVYGPVVGGISINFATGSEPTVFVGGHLADPTTWECSWPEYDPATPFRVRCELVGTPPPPLRWECAVLHANAWTTSETGRLQTSMDCDGDDNPEAETDVVAGAGDSDFVWAQSAVEVTEFVCTVSNGLGNAAVPSFNAFCGDPGVPHT